MQGTTGHTGCDGPQVLQQSRRPVNCPRGEQRPDHGLEVGAEPGPCIGDGETSPEKPLHRILVLERLDADLGARRPTVKLDPGAVELQRGGVRGDDSAQLQLSVPVIQTVSAGAAGPDLESVAIGINDLGGGGPPREPRSRLNKRTSWLESRASLRQR